MEFIFCNFKSALNLAMNLSALPGRNWNRFDEEAPLHEQKPEYFPTLYRMHEEFEGLKRTKLEAIRV
uniref:Uncharacterized protein n=1 Tax=Cucumis sativus TaxID=3659 RepID=A0A0A0KB32_CUCSA